MYSKRNALSVLIVSASAQAEQYLRALLPSGRYFPVQTATDAGEARRLLLGQPFDIVLINTPLPDEFGTQLAVDLSEERSAGILIFVKSDVYEQVSDKLTDYGVLTLARPGNRQSIQQTIQLLTAMRMRMKSLEQKTHSLEIKMQEIRIVNRAKWLLIDRLQMSEEEAHKYIEKTAMDSCCQRLQVAEDIIKTYDR